MQQSQVKGVEGVIHNFINLVLMKLYLCMSVKRNKSNTDYMNKRIYFMHKRLAFVQFIRRGSVSCVESLQESLSAAW
jgi:hypothetical protein